MTAPAQKLAATPQKKNEGLFSSPEKRTLVLCLLLAALTLVLYNQVTHHDFVNYDDDRYVTDNAHVRAGLTADTISWAFRSTQEANWHPVTWLSHALDCQLFHLNPAGHHYSSVLLHAVNVILLFLLLEKATGSTWRALMVAVLFAVHPINVESVAWIAERKNVLCTLFLFLALFAYGWYAAKPGIKRYCVVALLFALGLMAKPMVITFPFALLLVDFWPLRRMRITGRDGAQDSQLAASQKSFGQLLLEKVPLLALSAGSAVITMIAQKAGGAVRSVTEYSVPVRIENAVAAYGTYIVKAFWPTRLAALYPHPGDSISASSVVLSALLLIAVTSAALIWSRFRFLSVGWFWFLGTMVPVIGLVQVGAQAMADRYAYIPFLGLYVMAVWGIGEWASSRGISAKYLAVAGVLCVGSLSAVAYVQASYWHDSLTLWSHALAVTDRNYVAQDNMGNALVLAGKYDEAIPHFEEAVRINPRDPLAELNLGTYDQQHGKLAESIDKYEMVLRLTVDPRLRANAFANMGSAYRKLGRYSRAQACYESALDLDPVSPIAVVGLGLVFEKDGNPAKAAEYFSRAVQSQPTDVSWLLLSEAFERSGQGEKAKAAATEAERISPDLKQAEQQANQLQSE